MEAFEHLKCACDTEVTRCIGVACVHDPRSGQERHMNTDRVIKGQPAATAVVAIRRLGDADKFPEE